MLTYFSKDAYNFFYFIASVAILPPYVFSGAFALKLALSGETYRGPTDRHRRRDLIIGLLATLYGLWLVYAAGLQLLLMATLLFAPGILVYAIGCRQRGVRPFAGSDLVIAMGIVALAAIALYPHRNRRHQPALTGHTMANANSLDHGQAEARSVHGPLLSAPT